MPSRISQMRNGQLPQQQQIQPQQIDDAYIEQIKTLMRSQNSTQLLANIAASNPQMKQILQMISNGGNSQAIAQQMARARGIDLNQLINKLMS